MAIITSFRSAEICRGVKWSAMIPCADIRACRAKVSNVSLLFKEQQQTHTHDL
jgi:hypothetical protein